jgi:hypothetical protein
MTTYVYHGSKKANLKILKPKESGFGKKFVYACDNLIFAAIFIHRPGGSFLAGWGREKDKIPYFFERKKGIFNKWYNRRKGYLYVLNKKDFRKKDFLWDGEVISEKSVKVIKKIKIDNLKKYFENLEKEGKFRIIKFKDRLKYFPKDEEKLIKSCANYILMHGKGAKSRIRKLQPRVYPKALERIRVGHKVKGEDVEKYEKNK